MATQPWTLVLTNTAARFGSGRDPDSRKGASCGSAPQVNNPARVLARGVAVLLVAVFALLQAPARAQDQRFDPEFEKAITRLNLARGPEAYAALRRLWGTWDRVDPLHVEEELRLVENDRRQSAAVRVYAGSLAAYARLRRGDVTAARRKIASLGYIDDWLVVGPFDNEGKAGYPMEFGPELDFERPMVPGRAYTGKERAVRWRVVPPDAYPFGWLDTGSLLRPAQHTCTYATTFVEDKKQPRRRFTAWVGTSGAYKLYFNGRLVLEDAAYRGHDADRKAVELELFEGPNNLTIKACGDDEAPVVSVRLADERGEPDSDLTTRADFTLSEPASALAKRRAKDKPRTGTRGLKGPVQMFDELVERKNPAARDLYGYAEYLVYTNADDPTEHLARDFARRAAEKEPTVERLLLAGLLAEDRNQEGEWLSKASAVAQKTEAEWVEVLLAQAAHARGGVNWRDAFPYFDQVLELEPNNVDGIQGRVELYNEAGLRRTALATLKRGLERNPNSVNLINMYASQLRALGRSTEASEAESRYSALRFDDRGYIARRIDLAVARRNRAAAERWIDRLLAVAPNSQWALGQAARSYRKLGEPERAVATYQRALELAPEDVSTLRTLADLHGELGMREEQLKLLRHILKIRPQEREVREYLEHIEPPKARPDEAYAWKPKRFLKGRDAPSQGENRRTLRDLTVTTVYPNGKSSTFRQVVYQPLTDAAAASLRQYGFQYQADREIVQLRGARVYRSNGKVDEAIEYGEGAADQPWMSMYTSARTFYIQLPRLDPGDVVALQYRVDDTTPRNEFADYFGDVVYLQSAEPVSNAEYVLITPKKRKLHIDTNMKGLKRSVKESGPNKIYRFFAKSVPGIDQEPAMPPLGGALGHVHVSTYANYKEMGQWYWGLSKDQLELDDETRELARRLGKGAKTDMEKVRRVFNWVVKNTRYVALEFGIYGYKPRRCVQTVARGWGDCKDKATVIVALLKELGIDATLVIVRTQNRGDFQSRVASLAPFDHAIAYVPSLDLYLDGTAEYAGATELPEMDLEAEALLINEGDGKRVRLPKNDPKKHFIRRRIEANLAKDGSADLDLDFHVEGQTAPALRLLFHAKSTLRERVQTTLVGKQFPGFVLAPGARGVKTNDLEDLDQPVTLAIHGKAPSFARREGDQLSVGVTPGRRLTSEYASIASRKHDVRILAFAASHDTFVVHLPHGAKVVSVPPDDSQTTKFGSYSVAVEQSNNQVVVKSHLEITTTRVSPAEYADWQSFCNAVDSAFSHRLFVKP